MRIEAAKAQLPASDALKHFLEWKNAEERLSPGGLIHIKNIYLAKSRVGLQKNCSISFLSCKL
ncbi:hypothetical protein ACW4YW_09155 [Methylobacillus pratensis]|uniref:hypothetical protein n=1 Tax=Methylobacillus sp. Pita1 TaxID=3382642 RepID=UPI0038B547CC